MAEKEIKQLYKQSETIEIKRSQINLNPYNPKKHSDNEVKEQVKNIKKNGFNGGIKWNAISGNLIDGHRRCKSLDIINKYDGTPEKDYVIKVEKVEFDNKTEMEQMTYEALGNTRADYNLVADYASSIDLNNIGLSDADLNAISSLIEIDVIPVIETFEDFDTNYTDKKDAVKAMKRQIKDKAIEDNKNQMAYITLSFSSYKAKEAFCDLIGVDVNDDFCKGELVLRLIE